MFCTLTINTKDNKECDSLHTNRDGGTSFSCFYVWCSDRAAFVEFLCSLLCRFLWHHEQALMLLSGRLWVRCLLMKVVILSDTNKWYGWLLNENERELVSKTNWFIFSSLCVCIHIICALTCWKKKAIQCDISKVPFFVFHWLLKDSEYMKFIENLA